ncbi:MAG: CBS domain-containing protein, partial [Chloroflexi bacterium]|nr:CBS domain-containing protein [Chloroflexota bacterium]
MATRTVKEVMTHSVAACSPDTTLMEAAKLMSDLNIGNVVVVEDGKADGIITDRDITVRAVAKGADIRTERIKDYMTPNPVTGKTDWDLDKVADTMAKHQVRRLPIVDNGQVVGIVSLGDVARHDEHKSAVAGSLKDISQPSGVANGSGHALRQVA